MFAKRTGMVLITGLALTGAGVAGAAPADAATGCNASWERVDSYPTGAPNVSTYINDIYEVKVKNCGSRGELRVDVARAVDKCLGKFSAGQTSTREIKVTYQDMFPWNVNPPKPRGITAGC